jgi:hypothetical protein
VTSGGNAQINIGAGTIGVRLTDIASVEMTVPTEMKLSESAPPDRVIALLQPLTTKFKGLPADWVVDAMGRIADAYAAQNKNGEAAAVYKEMASLYPGSRYLIKANVGMAKTAFQDQKYDETLRLVKPLVDEANKKLFPTANEARLYSEAFLVQGQAYEGKGEAALALESYLTVVTIFFQNPETVKAAQQKADQLRQKNPGLTVS